MAPQFRPCRIAHSLMGARCVPWTASRLSHGDSHPRTFTGSSHRRKRGDRSTFSRLRNFWILWFTTSLLICLNDAAAQASCQVTDLGAQGKDNLGCPMSLNNEGAARLRSERAFNLHASCSSLRRLPEVPHSIFAKFQSLSQRIVSDPAQRVRRFRVFLRYSAVVRSTGVRRT